MLAPPRWSFRVTYARQSELRADALSQMARGALLVKVAPDAAMRAGDIASLELVLPGGAVLSSRGELLNVLAGHGVAISIERALLDAIRKHVAWQTDTRDDLPTAVHARLDAAPAAPPPAVVVAAPDVPPPVASPAAPAKREVRTGAEGFDAAHYETLSASEKIQVALHGSRDERNAVLRDRNRTLHAFVLKNPQITAEDVAGYARNAQMAPEFLKQIGERKEWLQRSAIAQALARNPKTPTELAIRALDHVGHEALKLMAKGIGAPPHVVTAARKRVVGT